MSAKSKLPIEEKRLKATSAKRSGPWPKTLLTAVILILGIGAYMAASPSTTRIALNQKGIEFEHKKEAPSFADWCPPHTAVCNNGSRNTFDDFKIHGGDHTVVNGPTASSNVYQGFRHQLQ
jgi:hypothetical protein